MNFRFVFPALALMASLVAASCASSNAVEVTAASSAGDDSLPAASPIARAAPSPAPSPALAPSAPVARQALPVRLLIPAIQVDATVEQVGNTPDGAMDVPAEWSDVGWYKLGVSPGERGNAVISGHLDSTSDRAVFWDLHNLKSGDLVQIAAGDGSRLSFAVVASEIYPFDNAPLQKIFGPANGPR